MAKRLIPELESTQGDTAPLDIAVVDGDGLAVDLTGTTVTFSAVDQNDWTGEGYAIPPVSLPVRDTADNLVLGASASVSGNVATFTPTSTQTATPGVYYWQLKIVSGSTVTHFPTDVRESRWTIHPNIN